MPLRGEYEPSASETTRNQVELYETSGGTKGTTVEGSPAVIVTCRGARSGNLRKFVVMRVEHDGTYAIVASLGGRPKNPVWYQNILAHPEVELQDGPARQDMTAREAKGNERATWWDRAVTAWPAYSDYQASTERTIPLLILEPAPLAEG